VVVVVVVVVVVGGQGLKGNILPITGVYATRIRVVNRNKFKSKFFAIECKFKSKFFAIEWIPPDHPEQEQISLLTPKSKLNVLLPPDRICVSGLPNIFFFFFWLGPPYGTDNGPHHLTVCD
jgi:hypothetical protein